MIFDEKSAKVFSRIINRLAEKYRSETFQPHLTLAGVPDWPEQRMIQAVEQIRCSTYPFELLTSKVRCKSFPYQKITLEVEKTEALESFHQEIDKIFEGDYSKKAYPHISLLYSPLSCKNLQNEWKEIEQGCPNDVLGNKIALVHCKGTPKDWRTLYIGKLN